MIDFGFVYVLKNDCMPHYYKVGMTRLSVQDRIKSLSSTSLPKDFECVISFESDHVLQLERHLHKELKAVRFGRGREFFFFQDDDSASSLVSSAVSSFNPRPYSKVQVERIKKEKDINSPSNVAKRHGCKSLAEIARVTKQSEQTLINWHRNKPELFEVVCVGVANLNQLQ